MSKRTENVIKNSTASLVYKVVQVLIKFVLRTVFIKALGNEYTGVSSLFTDILSVLSLIEMGTDVSLIYSLYGPLARKDHKQIAALMNFYRKAFLMIGVAVMCIGIVLLPALQYIVKDVPDIKEDIRLIFMMYIASSASSYFYVYKTVLLKADQKGRISSIITAVVHVVECVVEVILILVLKEFFAYLIVHLISTVARNVILSARAEKMYPEYLSNREEHLTAEQKKPLIKNIAALCVYNLASVVLNSTDSIFISAFVGTAQVAIIGNFSLITRNIKNLIKMVVDAARPSVGNKVATDSVGNHQELLFHRINFLTFWVACVCSTCLIVLLNPFVGEIWFNASYKISFLIIVAMVMIFYISVMSMAIGTFRSANGLFVQGWYRPAAMSAVNIILDYFFGKRWGVSGIYIATVISLLSTQVWFDPYVIYKNVFKKSVFQYYKTYLIMAFLTAVSCAGAYYLSGLIPVANRYLRFLLKAIVAVAIPNVIIVALYFKTDEFAYVKGMASRLTKKLLHRH